MASAAAAAAAAPVSKIDYNVQAAERSQEHDVVASFKVNGKIYDVKIRSARVYIQVPLPNKELDQKIKLCAGIIFAQYAQTQGNREIQKVTFSLNDDNNISCQEDGQNNGIISSDDKIPHENQVLLNEAFRSQDSSEENANEAASSAADQVLQKFGQLYASLSQALRQPFGLTELQHNDASDRAPGDADCNAAVDESEEQQRKLRQFSETADGPLTWLNGQPSTSTSHRVEEVD